MTKERKNLEEQVLASYNDIRREHDLSPMETYLEVAKKHGIKPWSVQYIIIKARRQSKEIL